MSEGRFPINARMTDCTIERNKICEDFTIDLSVDFRLVKPVNVRKRELVVKTGGKNANLLAEAQRYGALSMTTISNR